MIMDDTNPADPAAPASDPSAAPDENQPADPAAPAADPAAPADAPEAPAE